MPKEFIAAQAHEGMSGVMHAGNAVAHADIARKLRQAAGGDPSAWEWLVRHYNGLIWALTRNFGLSESDAADVVQVTWLRLLENIDRIEFPHHVGSWLAATARNECLRTLAARRRVVLVDENVSLNDVPALGPEVDEHLLAEADSREVRDAVSRLPVHCQRLLELLMADPPVPYSEISTRLGIPVGSIGPNRRRCLERLSGPLKAGIRR